MKNEVINKLLYCIFPRRCALCGDVIEMDKLLCDNCMIASRITDNPCSKCGREKRSCNCKMQKHKPDYERIIAPFYYDESTSKAVHRFKFYGYKELSDKMSQEMISCIRREYKNINFDAITFVPLSKKRQKARGYNQSYILASLISKELNIPLENTFYKAYENQPQRSQSNARQRRANVFGAFDINEDINPEGKTYLVIDDVKTTGSTLNECAAVLDSYGAVATYVCTFAIR